MSSRSFRLVNSQYDIIQESSQYFKGVAEMEKVSLFVDGGSMFYAQRDNGWHIDYRSVYHYFFDNREKVGAWYFTAKPQPANTVAIERYLKFRHALTQIGFSVKDKDVRVQFDKETGQPRIKGNLDIELVFRMLSTINSYDTAVLMGGDSDYIPLVEHLINNGKRVIIVGRRQSTAIDLINAANQFLDLNDIRDRIVKQHI